MGQQPTPEEAANALQDVDEHRKQAASPNAYPKWTLGVIGLLVMGVGVSSDLRPDLSTPLLYLLAAAALLLTYLPRWKRAGSALGYQRSPEAVGITARGRVRRMLAMVALIALFGAVAVLLRSWEAPYPTTIASALVLLTMPLWHRALNGAAREPKVS